MESIELIFTGSMIEADLLAEMLEENGIPSITRNTMEESLIAGWASGSQGDAGLLYVDGMHKEAAQEIIRNYLSTR